MPKLQTTISQTDMSPYKWAKPKKIIGANTKGRINLLMFKYLIRCKRQVYLWEQCLNKLSKNLKVEKHHQAKHHAHFWNELY
jgi:hypothetical protein